MLPSPVNFWRSKQVHVTIHLGAAVNVLLSFCESTQSDNRILDADADDGIFDALSAGSSTTGDPTVDPSDTSEYPHPNLARGKLRGMVCVIEQHLIVFLVQGGMVSVTIVAKMGQVRVDQIHYTASDLATNGPSKFSEIIGDPSCPIVCICKCADVNYCAPAGF